MSYNVQALFDSVDNGNEYKDYSVEKGLWSEALYRKRLANLVSAITGLCPEKPDILVLQEIENEVVLDDLADALGGYEYRIAAPPGSNAITVGILCRYPVVDAVAHQYQVGQLVKNNARLLLEVRVNIDGIPLIVLAAHWKSKKEGAVATEAERKIAARLARDIITARKHEQPTISIILAGDLNTNPDEYERVNKAYTTALMPCGSGPGPWLEISGDAAMVTREPLVLYSPWFTSEGYSYCYENTRERIDNFLLTVDFLAPEAPLLFLGFSANPPGFLIDEAGNPLGWNSRTGSGYSDHLPIVLRLQIVQS